MLRPSVLSYLMLAAFCLGATDTALAQFSRETTVEVGKDTSFRLRREVNPGSVTVTVEPRNIARAWLDTNLNRFRIEGLQPGTARITFAGTYRALITRGVRERAVNFRETIDVTVLPGSREINSGTISIPVSRGNHRDYPI